MRAKSAVGFFPSEVWVRKNCGEYAAFVVRVQLLLQKLPQRRQRHRAFLQCRIVKI